MKIGKEGMSVMACARSSDSVKLASRLASGYSFEKFVYVKAVNIRYSYFDYDGSLDA